MALTLTDDLILTIADRVRTGDWPQVAARVLGVPSRTMRWWLRHGRELQNEQAELRKPIDKACSRLLNAIEKAEADCEALWLRELLKAAEAGSNGKIQAYFGLMERRFPDRWGRKTQELEKVRKERPEEIFAKLQAEREAGSRLPG